MAEKIEMFAGWDWDGSAIVGRERNAHIDKECTVVVHDGKPERVFTESEVVAIIREITEASRGRWSPPSEGREIAARHGIVLDPA